MSGERTTCPYCGVGCGVVATVSQGRSGSDAAITADKSHPANGGRLCSKGAALPQTLDDSARLKEPTIGGALAGWDEALDLIATRFREAIVTHGSDSVAFYVSGQFLTEDYYVANKLMKGFIGSANIDTNSRLCMASTVAAHVRAFGEDVMPGVYEDWDEADLVVLVGSNAAWCHPVLHQRLRAARAARGTRIVVLDPRRTATAEAADLHLPLASGSDIALFNGLLVHLDEAGRLDQAWLGRHTQGAAAALAAARADAPALAVVAATCGVDPEALETFYTWFAETERVMTVWSQGVNQSIAGTDTVNAIINCHLATGRIGRPGMGPFSVTGQPNAMGGREVGGLANQLTAHMRLESAADRELVRRFWGAPHVAEKPGLKAVELFEAVEDGRVKAIWIAGTNPAASMPRANRVRRALAACPFVVVSDCWPTDTTKLAHVVLPAAGWGEKDGTVTNSERRISRQRQFLTPLGEARPDWWIVSEVARRMGFEHAFRYASPGEIFDEHARLSALARRASLAFDITGLAGLSAREYEELEPTQWPVQRRGAGGMPRLFHDGRFMHPDGKARLVPVHPRGPHNATDASYPFALNTGRIRDQWHTMTRTGRAPLLTEHLPEPFVDLHAHDALLTSVREGELATVRTRWGSMVARVRTSGEVPRGTLFVPMHWNDCHASEGRVGALVNPVVDPLSGEPEFKHTPASIQPFPVAWYGVVLARQPIETRAMIWWTLIYGAGFLRYELAGREVPADWVPWVRDLLGVKVPDADYLEYCDAAAGVYRAAYLSADRLEACAYFFRRPELPARAWLASLFTKERLDASERTALLAGRPLRAADDAGALVCSCFGVGSHTLRRLIAREGLTDARQVGERLRAGTNCGSCLPEIRELLARARDGA